MQWAFARLRLSSKRVADAISNQPLLLMRNGEFLADAMQEGRVSRENLLEKIRGSSATRIDDVSAIVLETTGDMHVMIGKIDPQLMEDVRGWDEPRDGAAGTGDDARQSG